MGTRAAGGVVSRKMTIAIRNGVVKPNDPSLLKNMEAPWNVLRCGREEC